MKMEGDFITVVIDDTPFDCTGTNNVQTTTNSFENCGGRRSKGNEVIFAVADAATCSSINADDMINRKFHKAQVRCGRRLPSTQIA